MNVKRGFNKLKARFKEIGMKSSSVIYFLYTVVHYCCIMHNILLASKHRILDQILKYYHLPRMDDVDDLLRSDDEDIVRHPMSMSLISEEKKIARRKYVTKNLLDYLVCIQNVDYIARHPKIPRH